MYRELQDQSLQLQDKVFPFVRWAKVAVLISDFTVNDPMFDLSALDPSVRMFFPGIQINVSSNGGAESAPLEDHLSVKMINTCIGTQHAESALSGMRNVTGIIQVKIVTELLHHCLKSYESALTCDHKLTIANVPDNCMDISLRLPSETATMLFVTSFSQGDINYCVSHVGIVSVCFTYKLYHMDPGDRLSICDSSIPFILEKTAFGSVDGRHRPKVKPELLSLFPLKPTFERLTRKNSARSFSGSGETSTQQSSEQDSLTVVAVRGESEFESRTYVNTSASLLSSFLALEYVPEKTDQLQAPLKKPRKEQSSVSFETPCRAFVDGVCHQSSSSTPSVDPYNTPATLVSVQCVSDGVGELVDLKSRSTRGSTYQYNGESSTFAFRKSNGSASTFPSRASAEQEKPLSRSCAPLDSITEGKLGAPAVGTLSVHHVLPLLQIHKMPE
ncbi:unnamed protein product [Calypogeia fissa]